MYVLNRAAFFGVVRSQFGKLNQKHVDGFNKILDEWIKRQLSDVRWLANMLAQTWHESAHTMQPIREMGGDAYLKSKPYYPWVGEGLIQVTWEENAKKFGAKKPGDLLTWPVALRALFDGMIEGLFTGKKLTDYFDVDTDDPINARRIVNGTDKASLIAGYHRKFLYALMMALDSPQENDPSPLLIEAKTTANTATVLPATLGDPEA